MTKFFFPLALVLLTSVSGHAASPLDVVKQSNQEVLDIYSQKSSIDKKTEKRISKIVDRVTNFEKISKKTIAQFCKKITADQCREFDAVFQELLRTSSLKRLGRYRADRFDYTKEEIDGKKAVVKTVAFFGEEQVDLDYHLELEDGKWTITNYVADDVDTIRNYRKQFKRLLRKESFADLIMRLKRKIGRYSQTK